MIGSRIKTKEWNLVNKHNVSIMKERHHMKEGRYDNFHFKDIVSPKDKIEIQGSLDYHNINTNNFYLKGNRHLRKDP